MMILEKREVWQELFSLLSQYSLFWSPQQIQASSSESGFNSFSAMGDKPVPYSTILDHWSVCLKYHFCLWAVRKGVDCSLISRYFPFSIAQLRRRQWHPTPVLLPGKSHGRRSLVGCSPWGSCKSDMTEQLHFHFPLSCIGERNGNPLQCSCLENPRDGGAWWAVVYGVAQSRTWLKRLSSSSSTVLSLGNPYPWSE